MGNEKLPHTGKSISSVVSTILLLVVVILALIAFTTWVQQYISGLGVTAHEENEKNFYLERYESGSLFIRSVGENVNIDSIKVGEQDCSLNESTLHQGLNELNLTCPSELPTGRTEFVIVSSKGVTSYEQYLS